jgi:hypothetical protein
VPGEAAAKVVQTKEPQHKDDFDEWLARIICFAFSVPPQWATKAMNRATADNQSAQSEEEGLEPTKEWVKDLIDEIVAEEFDSPDLELHWLDEDEGDPETVLEGRVKLGAVTLNEMRDALGLDPSTTPPPTARWCSPPPALCRSRPMRVGRGRRRARTDRAEVRATRPQSESTAPTSRVYRLEIRMAGSGRRATVKANRSFQLGTQITAMRRDQCGMRRWKRPRRPTPRMQRGRRRNTQPAMKKMKCAKAAVECCSRERKNNKQDSKAQRLLGELQCPRC